MREIVIEEIIRGGGDSPSLVDQIDTVLKDIGFELGKLAEDSQEPRGLDAWVERIREQFWRRQFEVIDDSGHFWLRMAAPGFSSGQMRVVISGSGVEVRGEGGTLLRQIPLPEHVDPRTIYAVFNDGYLQLSGARYDPEADRRSAREKAGDREKRAAGAAV